MANGEWQIGRPVANGKRPMIDRKANVQWQMAKRKNKWQMANNMPSDQVMENGEWQIG